MIAGLGYNQRDVQKCQVNGLVYVPFTGRCETPEIARQMIAAAQRHGLGFAAGDFWDFDSYDDYGNNWDWWFGGGGGDSYSDYDLPVFDVPDWSGFGPAPDPSAHDARVESNNLWDEYFANWLAGNVDSIDTFAQASTGQPSYRDITGSLDYQGAWDWLADFLNPGPGPAPLDPQVSGGPLLPGYCPKGTYHPINDPFACVPFPNDDATKKKAAATQRQGQQQQARQQQKAQQQASQTCPKDPQGRAVWRNPATQKCELVPQCPSGQKFDQVTRRCLTTAQRGELYGNQSSWLWWIIGGVLFLLYVGNRRGNESSTPWRRKR